MKVDSLRIGVGVPDERSAGRNLEEKTVSVMIMLIIVMTIVISMVTIIIIIVVRAGKQHKHHPQVAVRDLGGL